MAREIPEVVRAAAGLAATVLDEVQKLPETLPGLPVRVIGLAMQQAMKVQQQYAGLVARGDELFTGLRGENEPGLATFDDDDVEPAPGGGFRESAFDRADSSSTVDETLTDAEVEELPADPAADAVTSVVDELAEQVEDGRQTIEELAETAPGTEEILDEIAIDELVDQAPTLAETAPTADADALETALLESDDSSGATDADQPADLTADLATTVDVLTAEGDVATVDAAVTDEGIATAPETTAPETTAPETTAPETTSGGSATAVDESGSPVAEATPPAGNGAAVGAAPIDGYDAFSIAQLRGRLRGYQLKTVQDLFGYEQATRSREPYLRMLRNRLEKLEEQAVESSPLAPRG
ncbi:MAG: hypothetical protein JWQ99_3757 [Blastococcus sp.]|nr:hypothetical protein [Blastococcus sp.]